jgi:hypothetical protein
MKGPILVAALTAFMMALFLHCATVPQPRSESEANAENKMDAIHEKNGEGPQTGRLTLDHSQMLPEVAEVARNRDWIVSLQRKIDDERISGHLPSAEGRKLHFRLAYIRHEFLWMMDGGRSTTYEMADMSRRLGSLETELNRYRSDFQ